LTFGGIRSEIATTHFMATDRRIEFGVEQTRKVDDRLFVAGRCFRGPIRLGDVFTEAFKYQPAASLADYETPSRQLDGSHREARYKVASLHCYNRYLNQIDGGLTAEIELLGDSTSSLSPGDVLGGQSTLPRFESIEIVGPVKQPPN
jgi:hypothetical protein